MTALLMLSLLWQSPGGGQECSIAGCVLNASTSASLKNAEVFPIRRDVPSSSSEARTTTDAGGNFRFDHLTTGEFSLSADRNGYLSAFTRASCGSTDAVIKMTPQGMIFGKVVDDEGEAAVAQVTLYRRIWFQGRRQLQRQNDTVSQADGSFVIGNLATGTYYLGAKGSGRLQRGETFVENFFPDVRDAQAAMPVSVTGGAELRGINLHVRTARVYSIRGKATNTNGDGVSAVPLMLVSINDVARGSASSAGTSGGEFEFQNVAPGNYVIQAVPYAGRNGASMVTSHVLVTVGEEDVADVQVAVIPGAELSGVVKLDDAPSTQTFEVSLQPFNGGGLYNNARAKDGAFALHGVAPTLYHVAVSNLLDGYYLKAMRFAGRDIAHRELDLNSGASGTLEIQLSAKPAAITGTARNSAGDPARNAIVNVWSKDDSEVRQALTDDAGRFTLRNFPPGEYHVIAWEWIERGVIENPAFRTSFENQSAVVKLQEGSQENVDLKLIPTSASDAEIAKLP